MIGVDIVEIDRIRQLIEKHGESFIAKVFSPREIEYSDSSPANRYQRFAARFAAKEAVVKALGTGFRQITWADIHIYNDELGRPLVALSEKARAFCEQKGIHAVHISLSHTATYAVANAYLEMEPGGRIQSETVE